MGIGVSPSIIEVALFHRFITDTRILLCSLHLSRCITALQAWKATRARMYFVVGAKYKSPTAGRSQNVQSGNDKGTLETHSIKHI
jgi:hypothetical protein